MLLISIIYDYIIYRLNLRLRLNRIVNSIKYKKDIQSMIVIVLFVFFSYDYSPLAGASDSAGADVSAAASLLASGAA